MEFSVVIPCTTRNYNKSSIVSIYEKFRDLDVKFEIVLCSSSKKSRVCQDNVLLTNIDSRIKCYSISSTSYFSIFKGALNKCMYSTCLIVRLEDFSEVDLDNITSLVKNIADDRFAIYSTDTRSFICSRTYDLKVIVGVLNEFSIIDILNAFDYINSSLILVSEDGLSVKEFKEIVDSNKLLNKLYKRRKSKLYSTVLCEYSLRIEK